MTTNVPTRPRRRLWGRVVAFSLAGLALALGILAVGDLLADDDVDPAGAARDGDAVAADGGDPSEAGASTTAPGSATDDTAVGAQTGQGADPVVLHPDVVPSDQLPLEARVSSTTGLADGDAVTIAVTANAGSEIFGAEARLCAGTAVVQRDADMRPSRTGQCISSPLSSVSDDLVVAMSAPPYASVELTYRVGIGSETYTTQAGNQATITCDQSHPCLLAVKFQVPGGYGFRTYPVDFR